MLVRIIAAIAWPLAWFLARMFAKDKDKTALLVQGIGERFVSEHGRGAFGRYSRAFDGLKRTIEEG